MTWQSEAACVQPGLSSAELDEMFFGAYQEAAVALCRACPVADACLEDALRSLVSDDHGVRGGYTAEQRRSMRREGQVRDRTAPCVDCGSPVESPALTGRPRSVCDSCRPKAGARRASLYRERKGAAA